jgi:hypothetical protein
MFARFRDWGLVGDHLEEVDLTLRSLDGSTPLQLAAWNGQASVIASVLGPWPSGYRNRLAAHVRLNVAPAQLPGSPLNTTGHTHSASRTFSELDLAVLKQHLQAARLLVRFGGTTNETSGLRGADELLHRFVMLGDGITVEKLLQEDAFRLQVCGGESAVLLRLPSPPFRDSARHSVQVTPSLMRLLSRLKYPDSCTFTVAQAHNPMDQYMYECVDCGQTVCLVCRDLCHPYCAWELPRGDSPSASDGIAADAGGSVDPALAVRGSTTPSIQPPLRKRHTLRPLGCVTSTYCRCIKSCCRAIGQIDPREAAGFTWVPSPIDTRSVTINIEAGSELGLLVDKLAGNSHEVGRVFGYGHLLCCLQPHIPFSWAGLVARSHRQGLEVGREARRPEEATPVSPRLRQAL